MLDARLTAGFLWSQTHFLRSWCVLTQGLHDALEDGDAERVASFLCVEIGLAAMRAMEARSPWEEAVLAALRPLVEAYPEVRGRAETALALSCFLHGDLERAADHAQRAEALLATRHDAGLDVHLARIFGLEALYLSGRWRVLAERLAAVEAAYATGTSGFFAGIVDLQTGWMADLLADRDEADGEVREAALLGAGSAVHRANAQGDVATADAMTALIDGLEHASTPAERMAYLEALGNSGDARALPAIQSVLGAVEVEVVATAVMALRLMPASADATLLTAMSHPHPVVRGAALGAIGYRSIATFGTALLERFEREPEGALRATIVRLLQELAPTSPELAEVLAGIAAKDPDASVREAAAARAE